MDTHRGFTLLELVLVISIIGIISGIVGIRLSSASYWKEEGEIRRISEMIEFLYHQAAIDGYYYRLNFAFGDRNDSYQIGILGDEELDDDPLRSENLLENENNQFDNRRGFTEGIGSLTQELSFFLQPTRGRSQTLLPPPDLPSFEFPIILPENVRIIDVRTPRGIILNEPGSSAWLDFSPRGFSEFGVIHIMLGEDRPVTILINPFTGLTTIYREYRDFEWVWGQQAS